MEFLIMKNIVTELKISQGRLDQLEESISKFGDRLLEILNQRIKKNK